MQDYEFKCSLPNGLHARPASAWTEVAGRFSSTMTLVNHRSGATADARSLLDIVGADVRHLDPCLLTIEGADEEAAMASMREFIRDTLPACDAPLPPAPAAPGKLPRALLRMEAKCFGAVAASPGIGLGKVVLAREFTLSLPAEQSAGDPLQEEQKFARASAEIAAEIVARSAQAGAVEKGILKAHLAILRDEVFSQKIREGIRRGRAAVWAITEAGEFFATKLRQAQSLLVRERAMDVQDICIQLLRQITGETGAPQIAVLTEPSVVVAGNLTPDQFLTLDRRYLRGLVLGETGTTSHTIILARSFGIPTLTDARKAAADLSAGEQAIVDANAGVVIRRFDDAVRQYYFAELEAMATRRRRLAKYAALPARTGDGESMDVAVNIASAEEVSSAVEQGAQGVGLFRSEMLLLNTGKPLSEEAQFVQYSRAVSAAKGQPVILRTFDIGGDKPLAWLKIPAEPNPFLGCRGVRLYRHHPELFQPQLRAILRASAGGAVRLMIPMVTTAEEVRWVRSQIAEAQADLHARGEPFDPAMPVGVMVEVPSAAMDIPSLAKEVDFFSIGTNDLGQYFHAADRGNSAVATLGNPHNPAFLRLLRTIVEDARAAGRWVGVCGDMVREIRNLPLFIGLGVQEISVPAADVLGLKAAMASLSASSCRELLSKAMHCRDAGEVSGLLDQFSAAPDDRPILERELILTSTPCANKEEAIHLLVRALYAAGRTDKPAEIEEAVWSREAVYSTGVGFGFAIPHCKSTAVRANSIVVAKLQTPIEWGSMDGAPVKMVLLLAISQGDKDGGHMKILSTLARRLMHENFRAALLAAQNADEILERLAAEIAI